MSPKRSIDELAQEVERLPLQEQLKLVARISERLSELPIDVSSDKVTEERLQHGWQTLLEYSQGAGSEPDDAARYHDRYLYGKP